MRPDCAFRTTFSTLRETTPPEMVIFPDTGKTVDSSRTHTGAFVLCLGRYSYNKRTL